MKQIASIKDAKIQIQDDYIIVSNQDEKIYIDNNGNIIQDVSNLKAEDYPDKIGNYKKEQIDITEVYYIKQ